MPTTPTTALPLREFRTVDVTSLDLKTTSSYVVHESQVDTFVQAQKTLHFEPGINPHTQGRTQPIGRIRIRTFEASGPFWWSTPDLQENRDPKGAIDFSPMGGGEDVWKHPDILRDEALENDRELEAEARG
jgi:hypothetical protein